MLTKRFVASLLSVVVMLIGSSVASAQDFPNKPIRIYTNAPGGGSDVLARIIAPGLSSVFGQSVVVDNRGTVVPMMLATAGAPPDGSGMGITGGSAWTLPIFEKTPWDMVNITPITVTSREILVAAVHPSVPVKSVKELVALAKAKPGALNFAGGNPAGKSTLAVHLFNSLAGVNIVPIPYSGTAAQAIGVASGEVSMVILEANLVMPLVRAAKLRALAVSSPQASALAPELPPIGATVPGYEWVGMTAVPIPAKTPEAIVNRLNREIVRVLTQPDVKQQSLLRGVEIVANSPEQAATAIKTELVNIVRVIKAAGIKVER